VRRKIAAASAFAAVLALSRGALADQPRDWQIWHQEPASAMMAWIAWFDMYTLYFVVPITLLVMVLLLIVMVRFRKSANPTPSRTSHHSVVEAVWTIVPIVILVLIAFPSFELLRLQTVPDEEPGMTVKVTGYQWYWGYEYQDDGELAFDSLMLRAGEQADFGKTDPKLYPRLLAVDNELVVPVDTMVRVLVTAADVLHSFALPSFGVKMDAVPGRINETWFKAEREGIFYGQCSELCGRDHAFMPIAVRVVSPSEYAAWKAAAVDDLEEANRALIASVDRQRKISLAGSESDREPNRF
jgi:cytochrome c oxidase subunit II